MVDVHQKANGKSRACSYAVPVPCSELCFLASDVSVVRGIAVGMPLEAVLHERSRNATAQSAKVLNQGHFKVKRAAESSQYLVTSPFLDTQLCLSDSGYKFSRLRPWRDLRYGYRNLLLLDSFHASKRGHF